MSNDTLLLRPGAEFDLVVAKLKAGDDGDMADATHDDLAGCTEEIVQEMAATEVSSDGGKTAKARALRWLIGTTGEFSPATILTLSLVRDLIGEAT